MRVVVLGALVLAIAPGKSVGTVEGTITVKQGDEVVPASGVVVYVVGFDEPPPPQAAEIRQRDKHFVPDLMPITAGQSVSFPNDDPFFHNVFSSAPSRKFDLGEYPKGETKTKKFPSVGVVDVFCNIHPQMAATILVLPNRRYARVAADGSFRIADVPPGRWTLYAYSRRAAQPASTPIEVTAGGTARVSLTLDETKLDAAHSNKFGERYRDPEKYR